MSSIPSAVPTLIEVATATVADPAAWTLSLLPECASTAASGVLKWPDCAGE